MSGLNIKISQDTATWLQTNIIISGDLGSLFGFPNQFPSRFHLVSVTLSSFPDRLQSMERAAPTENWVNSHKQCDTDTQKEMTGFYIKAD